jgi:hypothetical protein
MVEAIWKMALDLTLADDPNLPDLLDDLGDDLARQYEHSGMIYYLEEAIFYGQKAIDLTPLNYPDLASRFNSLGGRLARLYERTNKTEDLDNTINPPRPSFS